MNYVIFLNLITKKFYFKKQNGMIFLASKLIHIKKNGNEKTYKITRTEKLNKRDVQWASILFRLEVRLFPII